jgi:transposase InsO family protein
MILKASPSAKYEIIKEMTSRDNNLLNIQWLCDIAGVSRSGYYYWLKVEGTTRIEKERRDESNFALIVTAYQHRGYDKGVRGIHMRLLHQDPPVIMNPKKIRRLMRKYNLQCPIRKPNPYRRIAKAMMTNRVAPNVLNREFKAHGARMVLLTDITYIPRRKRTEDGPEKYSYLCVIMDAYTKEILAHVISTSLDVDFVLLTVNMLMEKHGDELKTDALIHSDQGCHYTSIKFIDIINSSRLRQSMSRKGNCWDNAPQESLFGHMKAEVRLNPSYSHAEIATRINDWVDYYNNERYQWSLAKLSPSEFYQYIQTDAYPLPVKPPSLIGYGNTDAPELIKGDTEDDTD